MFTKKKTNHKAVIKKVTKKKVVKKKISKKTAKIKTRPGLANKINLPVIITPDTLPLLDPNFEWNKFEKFSKALISKLFVESKVNIMGKRGEKQYGIDLIADSKNGIYFFAQCKRYKTYSVTQFKKAKSDLELNTDKCILLLACEASADLRLEVFGDEKWEIWDVEDISAKTFSLSDKERFEIIKKYFGLEWGKAFSEYNQFSSLASPFEYFRNFLNPKKIFNHSIPYLGRESELKELNMFIKSKHQALVLNAPGGIGKSRLLWELSKRIKNLSWDILFIREGMKPVVEDFQNIKSDKVLFIFDDAHRYDLTPYLSFIQMLSCKYKIIFSTRPQGRNTLKLSLKKLNIESQEIKDLELCRFSHNDAKKIVDKLLPDLNDMYSWPMAKLLAESTLVGTLACNLLKRKSITLSSLANDPEIKDTVMFKFVEELSGKIETKIRPETIQDVLSLISALAPIEYHQGNIEKYFLEATDILEEEVRECIADLLYSGLLTERGRQIRISPDILSDCILEESCFFRTGQPSSFFINLFKKSQGNIRKNLLKNISELDWRKKNNALSNSILLQEFWNNLSISDNEDLYCFSDKLETVQSIAYFQPIESYGFVLKAFEHLLKHENNDQRWRYSSCQETIACIIKDIIIAGYQTESLMMILWQIGKNDQKNLNPYPNHPIRVISDLCSYERNLPVKLYENTFQGLKKIIEAYNPVRDFHNPINILEGFLAKSSHSTYSHGNSFSLSPFHISYKSTKELRSKVLDLLKTLTLSTSHLKNAYSAVNTLSKTLSPPHPVLNLTVNKKNIKVWSKEVEEATKILIAAYQKTSFNLLKLKIKKVFAWERRWSHYPIAQKAVSKFLKDNPSCLDEIRYIPFSFWTYREALIKRESKDYKTRTKSREMYVINSKGYYVARYLFDKVIDVPYNSIDEFVNNF